MGNDFRVENFLSKKEVEILKEAHQACKKKRQADRIKTILLLHKGYSFAQIAEILMVDDSTLRRYELDYLEGGLDALLKDHYSGGLGFLSMQEQAELKEHLEQTMYIKALDVCLYVRKKYGVKYSENGMISLLHRLGFVYKKTKVIPGKADPEKQTAFLKLYRKWKRSKANEDHIYFIDGCHPMHNPTEGYGWILKGKEMEIPSNTGRNHLNINGAYCVDTADVIVREDEWINAQSTTALFDQIKANQPRGKIIIIADNARYYRSREVQKYLAKNPRVELKFLPPYCPNLNLQERIWRFLKEKVIQNKYYPTFSDFRKAVMTFFRRIHSFKTELSTLMVDNFQIITPNFRIPA